MFSVPAPLVYPDSREQMRIGDEPAFEETVSGETTPPCFGLERFDEHDGGRGEFVGDFSVDEDDFTGDERLLDEYMSGLLCGILRRR